MAPFALHSSQFEVIVCPLPGNLVEIIILCLPSVPTFIPAVHTAPPLPFTADAGAAGNSPVALSGSKGLREQLARGPYAKEARDSCDRARGRVGVGLMYASVPLYTNNCMQMPQIQGAHTRCK